MPRLPILLAFSLLALSTACQAETPPAEERNARTPLAPDTPARQATSVAMTDPEPTPSPETNRSAEPSPSASQPSTAETGEPSPRPRPAGAQQEEPPARPVPAESEERDIAPAPTPPDHAAWNTLLQRYVNAQGKVNYAGLREAQADLEAYLSTLAANPPQPDWSRNAAMAYWINAYNAFTVKLIVDHYPLNSIRDLHGGNPWDRQWIKLGERTYSLNQIEHDILRPRYGDSRIHFAVNCAAISCPPLHNRAFTADNLTATLDRLARQFINNENYNLLTPERVEVSKIFDWYGEDFGNLTNYLQGYTQTNISPNATIAFKEYDWALNKQ